MITATLHIEKTDTEAHATLEFEHAYDLKDELKARGFKFTQAGFGPFAGTPATWSKTYGGPASEAAKATAELNGDIQALAAIQNFRIERI